MSSCFDVPRLSDEAIRRGYGHLPEDTLKEWATLEADLSTDYADGKISGVSDTAEGAQRKQVMLERLDDAISSRGNDKIKQQYATTLRAMFESRLEDPGLMHNFEYFDVPSSDYMMMFYISTWAGRMADTMVYLHNYGWDLKGNFSAVPDGDVWAQMSNYEAMNISERIKAKSIVEWLEAYDGSHSDKIPVKVTAFGGGNLPERLYMEPMLFPSPGLPCDELTVFDDGKVRSIEELFPYADDREFVRYIPENLFNASRHSELLNSQHLVWMHGVSMYLGPLVPKALMSGFLLLLPEAVMKYDYLIMTESMRRVLATQGWPKGRGEMFIYNTPDEAIAQARKDVAQVNLQLGRQSFFDIEEIQTTLVEPWGATCVRVTLRKYV